MDLFLKIFYGVIIPLFALGVVVFVHELGHFWVARRKGIIVDVFSIGFGPKIAAIVRGSTEYRISWIPFGGYVKFRGDEIEGESDVCSIEGGFYAASPMVRTLSCVAGPVMNILFGFLLYCVIAAVGKPVLKMETTTVVGSVLEKSPAMEADIRPGDRILRVNGKNVTGWKELVNVLALSTSDEIRLQVERDGNELTFQVLPRMDPEHGIRRIGIYPMEEIVIGSVLEGTPAERAGLQGNDRILSLEGKPVYQWDTLVSEIGDSEGKILKLGIEREGNPLEMEVVPEANEKLGRASIGFIRRYEFVTIHPNPFGQVWKDIRNIFLTLNALFKRKVSAKGLAGPIGIIHIMGTYASIGFVYFLSVLALISVNLGVLNLFPIPVLDGGHILLNTLEQFRGRALTRKTMIRIQNVFVVIMVSLILLITYNDVLRWGKQLFGVKEQVEEQEKDKSVTSEK